MIGRDYYQTLGVAENANADAVKKAYRKLAKDYHPDTHPGDKNAEARFKEISEAYGVLSDSTKRRQYDQMRKFGLNGRGPGGGTYQRGVEFDLSDLFGGLGKQGRRRSSRQSNLDDFFGFGGLGDLFSQILDREEGFGQKHARPRKGRDVQATLEIPFETATRGGKKTFSVNREIACPKCSGTGSNKGLEPQVCTECRGSGMVSKAQGAFAVNRPCPKCLGNGQIIKDPCGNCNGSGRSEGSKQYTINITAGTGDGKKLRLSGQGNSGANGQPSGDLILTLRVAKHKFFEAKGFDIHCEVPIDKKRAKQGTKVKVKTVHGDTVVLTIPPKTETGRTFRLKEMGIQTKNAKGDQLVRIKVK